MLKINIKSTTTYLITLACLCFLLALFIAINYANQPLLEIHSFRQTQTALNTYWLIRNGFSLAYETPNVGYPWSVPFEFPLYEYIVALIVKLFHFPLDAAGRITSFAFLTLCLIPAYFITKNLRLPSVVFYVFVALLFSSPIYLCWGRAFLIETTAVFFTLTALKYFIDIMQKRDSYVNQALYLLFMSIALLQKSTTALPVLGVLCLAYYYLLLRESRYGLPSQYDNSTRKYNIRKKLITGFLYFGLPLAIGIGWIVYTDYIKSFNVFGTQITSSMLTHFNWGTLDQRLSSTLFGTVIWRRLVEQNLAGFLGLAILMSGMLLDLKRENKQIILICLVLGIAPLFIFTNLHIVHNYYQTANAIFLLYAVAVALGCIISHYSTVNKALFPLLILVVSSNYLYFYQDYLGNILEVFNSQNSRDFAVAEFIKKTVPENKYFIAFGNDWSSSFTYLSQRKSFTVAPFFNRYDVIAHHPEQFIAEDNLGAVVVCPPIASPTFDELKQWSSTGRNWKITEVYGCHIATPA